MIEILKAAKEKKTTLFTKKEILLSLIGCQKQCKPENSENPYLNI